MRAIRFVLAGKFAHFRRFYTNSSSLTYPIPPPPTLRGLLGAALGLGPEYARELADWRFGVRIAAPWRFLFQTANFLKIKKGEPNLAGGEHTQIPLQFVAPRRLEERVRYEVLAVGPGVEAAKDALTRPVYPLSLGPAYALAQVEAAHLLEGRLQTGYEGKLKGPFLAGALTAFEGPARLLSDRYPLRLAEDRSPQAVADLVLEADGKPLHAHYQGEVFVLDDDAWSLVG